MGAKSLDSSQELIKRNINPNNTSTIRARNATDGSSRINGIKIYPGARFESS